MRRTALRLVGTIGSLALAAVALAAGSDRAGRALMVSGPFAQSARLEQSQRLLAQGSDAREPARQLMLTDPLRLGAATNYAFARQQAGDPAGAQSSLMAALGLGWRDPAAQVSAVRMALALGDPAVAAMRAEALLRAAPASLFVPKVLAEIAADQPARSAFAARMAQGGDWSNAVLHVAMTPGGQQLANRVELIVSAANAGYHPTRRHAREIAGRLFDNDPALAARVWKALAGSGESATHGLWQSGFGALAQVPDSDEAPGPFEWTILLAGAGRVAAEGDALIVSGSSGLAEPLVSQRVSAAPGTYRLEWIGSGRDDDEPDLLLSTQCARPAGTPNLGSVRSGGGRYYRDVAVDARCSGVIVTIASRPAGRTPSRISWVRWVLRNGRNILP